MGCKSISKCWYTEYMDLNSEQSCSIDADASLSLDVNGSLVDKAATWSHGPSPYLLLTVEPETIIYWDLMCIFAFKFSRMKLEYWIKYILSIKMGVFFQLFKITVKLTADISQEKYNWHEMRDEL